MSACLATALLLSVHAYAAVAPEGDPVASRATGHPDLFVRSIHLPLDRLPAGLAAKLRADLSALQIAGDLGAYDLRAGRWGSLIARAPLVPGPGVGNALTWAALGIGAPTSDAAYKNGVWRAFQAWLQTNQALLGVSTSELAAPSIGTYEKNRLVHVYAGRVYGGIPVRDSFVMATLNSGNLVLYGTRNWGTIDVATTPNVSETVARDVVGAHLSGFPVGEWGTPDLVIVPLANGSNPEAAVGRGYAYRLAWSIGAKVEGSDGSWEGLVDARTGELLAFYDRNSYLTQKKVVGGVFPVSNDGQSPAGIPDGVEQPGYPMSRAYVFQGATQLTANSEGLVNGVTGDYRTSLTGPFIRIQDGCGAANETSALSCDVLDLSTSAGTDCSRPAGHTLGDTHSARTGFYELNRLIDQAKSWLGTGAIESLPCAINGATTTGFVEGWLNCQLPANMNINNACNAFFSPADTTAPTTGSVNFYRQGILGSNNCRNTGEIAAVFDHEWGHGLDTYDESKGVSLPGRSVRRHDGDPAAEQLVHRTRLLPRQLDRRFLSGQRRRLHRVHRRPRGRLDEALLADAPRPRLGARPEPDRAGQLRGGHRSAHSVQLGALPARDALRGNHHRRSRLGHAEARPALPYEGLGGAVPRLERSGRRRSLQDGRGTPTRRSTKTRRSSSAPDSSTWRPAESSWATSATRRPTPARRATGAATPTVGT